MATVKTIGNTVDSAFSIPYVSVVASQQPHVNTTVSHPVRSPVRTILQLVPYLFFNDVHYEYPLVCTLFNVGIMTHDSHMVCALRAHGAAQVHNGSLHTTVCAQCPQRQPLFVRGPMDDSLGHSQWPPLGEQRAEHGCMGNFMNPPVGAPWCTRFRHTALWG